MAVVAAAGGEAATSEAARFMATFVLGSDKGS